MTSLDDLRTASTGPVLTPSDAGYADELAGFNLSTAITPEIVVGAADTDDVIAAVRYATEHGLQVRLQATGHGTSDSAGGLLITTRRLDGISVDATTGVATIGAGVRAGALAAAAGEHGLAVIAGAASTVGVVGLLLGGGIGPLVRSHGFGSDHVRAFTVVTATGEVVRASADDEPELFWALRGGKGGLGAVVGAQLQLVALPEIYAGAIVYDTEHIETVLREWVRFTAHAPDEASTSVMIMRVPPIEEVPEPLRGRTVISLRFAFPGEAAEGERLAAPFRALAPALLDTVGVMPSSQTARIHNDPENPTPSWVRGRLLSRIDQDLASALLAEVGPGVDVPLVGAELRHLGGRLGDDVPEGSAAGGRDGAAMLGLIGAPDPRLFDAVLPGVLARLDAALRPWLSGANLVNYIEGAPSAEDYASAWPAATRERLAAVRDRYDPHGVFAYAPAAD